MYPQNTRGETRRLLGVGDDGIYSDAWGKQKIITDHSQFHALFTYYVPDVQWIEYFNGVEQVKTNATSVNGELKLISNNGTSYLMGKENPRYQPNRGQIYSNSSFIDNATKTNGKLYAVVRTYIGGVVYEDRTQITGAFYSTLDLSKGNIFDIQMQWRGVGAISFFINQKEVFYYNKINNISNVTISNPALPPSFECSNDGTVRFGMFTPQCGVFFEWVFNSPANTSFRCGCVDVSSEGGEATRRFYIPIIGKEITVSDNIIVAARIPEVINGAINTRNFSVTAFKVQTNKKGSCEIYTTRDPSAITTTVPWVALSGGDIEVLSPTVTEGTTFDKAKAKLFGLIPLEANASNTSANPDIESNATKLTHGDIIILVGVGSVATMRGIIQTGEEV